MSQESAGGVRETHGIVELTETIESPFINHDLAPAGIKERKWATKDIAALWISMSACVTTYTLASSLIDKGMSWKEAVVTIFLGNVVVLIPMVLNAHAGTKYGIPFPVYCRAAFGMVGANVPAVLRALVACGWFGIQTTYGGKAIHAVATVFFPSLLTLPKIPFVHLTIAELAAFFVFWGLNVWVIKRGIESIRILLNIKAPLLIALGLALLYWAYSRAGGFGPMLSKPSDFDPGGPKAGGFWLFFFPALTGSVGYWATLSLNIPDFSRYAYSQRDQVVGQIVGLPTTMGLYAFIGVAVTSATVIIFGAPIWDPTVLITKFTNPALLVFALLALGVATLATNIAANVVSPANDFANLAPKKITFQRGGYITAILGFLFMPWKLLEDPTGYIYTWLIGYSALLGSIGGILICDYFFIRRTRLDLPSLYKAEGSYWYSKGWNPAAFLALAAGILPNLPGFLGVVKLVEVGAFWIRLYDYAWFVGFGLSFVTYAATYRIFTSSPPMRT